MDLADHFNVSRTKVDLYERRMDFKKSGFTVQEDGRGQLRYEVYDPKLFRALAKVLVAGGEHALSSEERRFLVDALHLLQHAYEGTDQDVVLVSWGTGQPVKGQMEYYFKVLSRIVAKLG